MNTERICLSSKTIDIAENDLYLELTNRMCYYDDVNLNNILLPYKGVEDKAIECSKSLLNMPVQAVDISTAMAIRSVADVCSIP